MLLNLGTGEHISIVRSDTRYLETAGILIAARKNVFDYIWGVVLSTLQDGWSSLMTASEHGHLQIAGLLIKRGANLNCQNNVSMTVDKVATYMN